MRKIWNRKYVGLILPILFLIALIIYPMVTVQLGETILLETIPYDPTDLFRGDYVELRYQVSELDESYLHESIEITEENMYENHVYYAVLKPEGKIHTVDYLIDNKPDKGLYLKCNAYFYQPYGVKMDTSEELPLTIDVDYNINRFYLKEGTGLELEEASREGTLLGEIKVFKGNGVLIDILKK